jgi:hypothetical protein
MKGSSISLRSLIGKLLKPVAYSYFVVRLKMRSKPHDFILMLSHMRSGSSLLTHILNANPEVAGFGENHAQYGSKEDLKSLIFRTAWKLRQFKLSEKYVLDKLLHDELVVHQDLLRSKNIRFIFLVRRPQETLASIVKLFSNQKWTIEKATEYYIERLSMLVDYAKTVNDPQRCLFISHEQLINQTDETFAALQDFLEVKHPFAEEYEILPTTGEKFVGDSSKKIKQGRIVRDSSSSRNKDIEIPSELLGSALQAFDQCCATLKQHCRTLESAEPVAVR